MCEGCVHSFRFGCNVIHPVTFLAAAPVSFKKELENQVSAEGGEASLSCETTSSDCKVTWRRNSTILTHGKKYTMQQRDATHILIIHKLVKEDSGEYTCVTGDKKSTATLTVKGKTSTMFTSSSLILEVWISPWLFVFILVLNWETLEYIFYVKFGSFIHQFSLVAGLANEDTIWENSESIYSWLNTSDRITVKDLENPNPQPSFKEKTRKASYF